MYLEDQCRWISNQLGTNNRLLVVTPLRDKIVGPLSVTFKSVGNMQTGSTRAGSFPESLEICNRHVDARSTHAHGLVGMKTRQRGRGTHCEKFRTALSTSSRLILTELRATMCLPVFQTARPGTRVAAKKTGGPSEAVNTMRQRCGTFVSVACME